MATFICLIFCFLGSYQIPSILVEYVIVCFHGIWYAALFQSFDSDGIYCNRFLWSFLYSVTNKGPGQR